MNGYKIIRFLVLIGTAILFLLFAPLNGYTDEPVFPGQEVFFTYGDYCTTDKSGSCSDIVNNCKASCEEQKARLQVATLLGAGISGGIYSRATLNNEFKLMLQDLRYRGHEIPANLQGSVSWAGSVWVDGGVGSTDASITAKVRLIDLGEDGNQNLVIAEQTMVDASCSTDFLGGLCQRSPSGTATYNMSVRLIRDHWYRFEFEGKCESSTGVAAAGVACVYADDLVPNGLSRGPVRLVVSRDFEAELDALSAKVSELERRFDNHTHTYLTGKGVGHNNTEATTTLPTSTEPTPYVGGGSGSIAAEDSGYMLLTNSSTGQAALWTVNPTDRSVISGVWIGSSDGIGDGWQATKYTPVSATVGYVLWTKSSTGQTATWTINPTDGSIISGGWVGSSTGLGGGWQATDYIHAR